MYQSFASSVTTDEYFLYVGGAARTRDAFSTQRAMLWIKPRGDSACSPADLGSTGAESGGDGVLDNNDFIVYIAAFFDRSPGADRGVTGGVPGADGEFDNNDFIVFIDQFFAGC
ncbi:MAG TPA: GC-type dockerin domain-anchored protein [Phycisphaerales bacterium]|nr:GC-type dockerin domain-anchored protein [Phycisphaerales bacterium]